MARVGSSRRDKRRTSRSSSTADSSSRTRYGAKLYAFVTRPARERETQFDDEAVGQLFWGVYATTPWLTPESALSARIPTTWIPKRPRSFASGTGAEKRHSLGVRVFGERRGLRLGRRARAAVRNVRAAGHPRVDARLVAGLHDGRATVEPRARRLQANVASGDTHAGGSGDFGTFNPLFFKAGYFNDASLIRPSNIMDVHPTVQVHPRESVMVTIGSDVLWRYTTKDGIYGPGGNLELPAGGGSRYVATTADVSAQWQLNRHATWIIVLATTFQRESTSTMRRAVTWISSVRGSRSYGERRSRGSRAAPTWRLCAQVTPGACTRWPSGLIARHLCDALPRSWPMRRARERTWIGRGIMSTSPAAECSAR